MTPEPNRRPRRPREIPASTGGVVDLQRIIGNIPVVFVFLPDVSVSREHDLASTVAVLQGIGARLADFGRERVQVLGVHPSREEDVIVLGDRADGNARILADPTRDLAAAFDVDYDDRVHVVVVGADGEVAEHWSDRPGIAFGERLLARVGPAGPAGGR